MHFTYRTKGTCSQEILFDVDGKTVKNIEFIGGCNEARLFVESAMEMLSPLEQEIFLSCLLGEMPIRQFAERNGMRKSTAWDMANSIRKKLQEIF